MDDDDDDFTMDGMHTYIAGLHGMIPICIRASGGILWEGGGAPLWVDSPEEPKLASAFLALFILNHYIHCRLLPPP